MDDKLFITKCKSDFERVYKYLQDKRENKKAIILQAIGDDWHCAFMIRYRYNKYIRINNYGKLEEVN